MKGSPRGIAAITIGLLGLMAAGCATRGVGDQRLARYRPDDAGRRPWEWARAEAGTTGSAEAPGAEASDESGAGSAPAAGVSDGGGAVLRRGDGIIVYLKNIPRPEDIKEEVDEVGAVTLPLIGNINVTGMSTAQAEDAITSAYIEGGFYHKIDVIVVAEAGSFYVRGEVKQPGGYPLSGDLTLVQAVTKAGGYTDFAKTSKIKVIRKQQDMIFNGDRIEDGKDPDPLIEANDTIIVPRRLF
jgi:protein involved in polysaccharide export with SLBB domain